MTYSWYNVSKEYNNDIIRYHNDTMLFLFRTLYIRELLIENDDMETDSDSPIKTEFDLTRFRCLVTILRGFTLDLRDSNFKEHLF